ncbi:hypothetical protein PVA17_16010 [Lysinibacillus sp. CNPSo 3705]|uniref:hypothetical protein n=1 Tax=Lysinibacillus sp. CNPSo 3705 TaxID=3028148 RepID=UPI00236371AE|nr:hypothetical protein [Lysinibacillus sp. CNPSo 3705]MDD1504251.1 hypothetical protein [Lysinibacillus sp. CNPSo 3705]
MVKPPVHPLLENISDNIGTDLYVVLSGYIGNSEENNIVRLYSSLETSHYIDIPLDAVINYSNPSVQTGIVKVFIRGSAYIKLVQVLPIRADEVFNGDDNPGDDTVDPPQDVGGSADGGGSDGGNGYTLPKRFRVIKHFKKLFKRYN